MLHPINNWHCKIPQTNMINRTVWNSGHTSLVNTLLLISKPTVFVEARQNLQFYLVNMHQALTQYEALSLALVRNVVQEVWPQHEVRYAMTQ